MVPADAQRPKAELSDWKERKREPGLLWADSSDL